MSRLIRSILVLAGAGALAAARVQTVPNVLESVVVNGPHAGTYKPPAMEVVCMHAKKQKMHTAAWRNLDFNVHDAKAVGEAGINVTNPDEAGAKYGDVLVAFGDRDKKQIRYTVTRAPLTLTIKGQGAEITFQGKTKEGIQLRVTAKCLDVTQA